MNYYFYRLIPPRPTFPRDMTEAEGKLMREHVVYWRQLLDLRQVVVFGPVADPRGTYGVAILELPEGQKPESLAAGDPVIKANAGFSSEIFPMLSAMARI